MDALNVLPPAGPPGPLGGGGIRYHPLDRSNWKGRGLIFVLCWPL